MSAPLLWIVLPVSASVWLLLSPRVRSAARGGAALSLFLALLAWQLPIEQPIRVTGRWGFRLAAEMHILGRALIIPDAARPWLVWFFLALALWLGGAAVARMEPTFVGLALIVVFSLMVALFIRPFLYAALLIETAALLAVPLLVPPGSPPGSGVLRFLTFQTMGMPFILLTGWMLVGTETSLPGSAFALRATVLLGVGFALLLGVFPFHSWMPMLTEEVHPYAAAFVLTAVTGILGILGLGFLERYNWLRHAPTVYTWLAAVGALTVALAGVLAAFQTHAGRVLGYGVMMEVGLGLLALGQGGSEGARLFFALWPGKVVLFNLWSLSLTGLGRRRDGLSYRDLAGLGRHYPLLTAGALVSILGVAGAPLLAGLPGGLSLWQTAAGHPWILGGLAIGSMGFAAAATRLLGALVVGHTATPWRMREHADEKVWMLGLLFTLPLLALFPQSWWLQAQKMLAWFPHLAR